MKRVLSILSVVGVMATLAPAAQAEIVGIGRVELTRWVSAPTLRLPGGCPNQRNRYRGLQIEVRRNSADIDRVVVSFGNGRTQELQVRQRFAANSSSRTIDFNGGARCVESVRIRGNSDGNRSIVRVLGQR